jgi:glycerophosphoryl diester phosphodiesterase
MSSKFILIVMLCSFYSCTKLPDKIENLNNGKIAVIGHGGMGFQSEVNQLPHNSYSSISKALDALNCDGVELDVQLTSDEKLVLYHDETLQSMSNCFGSVFENNFSSILECRYKNDFFNQISYDEKIISLERVLEQYSQSDKLLFLDLKLFGPSENNYRIDFQKQLINAFANYNLYDKAFIQSLDTAFLNDLAFKNHHFKLILEGSVANETILYASEKKYWGVIFRNDLLEKQDVELAHSKGLRVAVFDVKTRKGTVDAILKHPDYIHTDNILLLQDCMHKIYSRK